MGYFSNLDIEMQMKVRVDRTYPSRCETLTWFIEDLSDALKARGVSVEELVRTTRNGLRDYYDPRARYHYYSVLWADKVPWPEASDLSIKNLVEALGEAAFWLEKAECDERRQNIQVLLRETSNQTLWKISA